MPRPLHAWLILVVLLVGCPAQHHGRRGRDAQAAAACTSDGCAEVDASGVGELVADPDAGTSPSLLHDAQLNDAESDAAADVACERGSKAAGVIDGDLIIDSEDTAGDLRAAQGVWCVTGDLWVYETQLRDLTALSSLRAIGGSLNIGEPGVVWRGGRLGLVVNARLETLRGLEQLTSIGDDLVISHAPLLGSTAALANLAYVGGDTVAFVQLPSLVSIEMPSLPAVSHNLLIKNLELLSSLSSLSNLASIPSLTLEGLAIRDLKGLENVHEIGQLTIRDLFRLVTLEGLGQQRSLRFVALINLRELRNLGALSVVPDGANVTLFGLAIADVDALRAMHTAEQLSLSRLPNLTSVDGLNGLVSVERGLSLQMLPQLRSLRGLSALTHAGTLTLHDLPLLSHLGGLSSLQTLGALGYLQISSSETGSILRNLDGVSSLRSLHAIHLWNLANLDSLAGLSALESLRDLSLSELPALQSLAGLTATADFRSLGADRTGLRDLTGLPPAKNVFLGLHKNPELRSLKGTEAMEENERLQISGNPRLAQCEIDRLLARIGAACDCSGNDTAATCSP